MTVVASPPKVVVLFCFALMLTYASSLAFLSAFLFQNPLVVFHLDSYLLISLLFVLPVAVLFTSRKLMVTPNGIRMGRKVVYLNATTQVLVHPILQGYHRIKLRIPSLQDQEKFSVIQFHISGIHLNQFLDQLKNLPPGLITLAEAPAGKNPSLQLVKYMAALLLVNAVLLLIT